MRTCLMKPWMFILIQVWWIMFWGIHAVSIAIIASLSPLFDWYIWDLPINGGWSEWGNWSGCSEGCLATRSRVCDNPPPLYRGLTCPDNDTGADRWNYYNTLSFSLCLETSACWGDLCCPGIHLLRFESDIQTQVSDSSDYIGCFQRRAESGLRFEVLESV